MVGQGVVDHVAVIGILERLAAQGRAHAIHRNHDEAQLGQCLVVTVGRHEAARTNRTHLRTWIDVGDDRILLFGIEMRGLEQLPIDVGFAVASFYRERFRCHPAGGFQTSEIGMRQFFHLLAIAIAHNGYRRRVDLRIHIDKILAIFRRRDAVIGILRRQQLHCTGIQSDLVVMHEVRVTRLATHATEPQRA